MNNLVRNAGRILDFPPYQTDGVTYIYRFGYQPLSEDNPDIYTFAEIKTFAKLDEAQVRKLFDDFVEQFGLTESMLGFKKGDYKI